MEQIWLRARQAYEIESDGILKSWLHMDRSSFAKAIRLLKNAPRIAASGCGHSGIACRHFVHLMCCINRPASFLSPSEALHGASGYLQKGDVLLLASRGGQTAELLPLLSICMEKKVSVITVTENASSPLAKNADVVLPLHITRETDVYNSQGTTSFTVLCVLFDAIQSSLIEATGFYNEDFALNHPEGAVGRRLRK